MWQKLKRRRSFQPTRADLLSAAVTKSITYGNMEEPYVIRLQIKSKKEVGGIEVADKITVQLMATDPYLLPRKAIVKTSEKQGFYLAMDIADIWLGRALAGKM